MRKLMGFGVWDWLCVIVVAGIIFFLLTGCKTKYVSVPEYHTSYIVRTDTFAKVDSVFQKDSVYVYHNGDTVVMNKVLYRGRYRNIYKVKCDTVIKRDSLSVPYPVERTLTKGEQRLMTLGRLFIGYLFLVVVAMVVGIWWYHNKK